MSKKRLATLWLDGCSGCHMSLLDLDTLLLDIAQKVDVVASPYVDYKSEDYFPDDIDVALVEGSVSSEEDLHKAQLIRRKSKVIVAFGDCAVTGNVSAMRNLVDLDSALASIYGDKADVNKTVRPETGGESLVPKLLPKVLPLGQVVHVDYYLPGCPVPAPAIHAALLALIEGREPDLAGLTRFGM